MLIDVSNDTIIINDTNSILKSYQISQICFWGFLKASKDEAYKLSSKDVRSIMLKLIRYFDGEEISYSLSPTAREYLLGITNSIDKFRKIKDTGEQFKKGTFDRGKFKELLSFIAENIHRQLKEHQIKAAFHLYLMSNSANFSVPGSGKTAVILTVYEKLRLEKKVNLLLVIGPPACFGPWRTEFRLTLGRDPECRVLAGGEQTQRKSEYFSPLSQVAV